MGSQRVGHGWGHKKLFLKVFPLTKERHIRTSLVVQWLDLWVGKIPWRKAWQPIPVFLPGESPWTEKPGGQQSLGSQRVRQDKARACMCTHVHTCTHTYTHTHVTMQRMRFNPWLENKIPQAAEQLSLHTTTSESRHYNEKYYMMQGRPNTGHITLGFIHHFFAFMPGTISVHL